MVQSQLIDEIAEKLSELAAHNPVKDLRKNANVMLHGIFSRFDLVHREEYEIQQSLLAHTREKLAALEQRVAQLESHFCDHESEQE